MKTFNATEVLWGNDSLIISKEYVFLLNNIIELIIQYFSIG